MQPARRLVGKNAIMAQFVRPRPLFLERVPRPNQPVPAKGTGNPPWQPLYFQPKALMLQPLCQVPAMPSAEDPRYQISVSAQSAYIREQSQPDQERYVFAYTITIQNTGFSAARLLNRHWIITDANGKVQEVRGEGVVGEQPHLGPGESFRYTSGTILETPVGSMHGSYEMIADDGTRFEARIDPFSLAMPMRLH